MNFGDTGGPHTAGCARHLVSSAAQTLQPAAVHLRVPLRMPTKPCASREPSPDHRGTATATLRGPPGACHQCALMVLLCALVAFGCRSCSSAAAREPPPSIEHCHPEKEYRANLFRKSRLGGQYCIGGRP